MLATLARYVPMAHDIRLSAFDMRLTPLDIFAIANENKDTSERSDPLFRIPNSALNRHRSPCSHSDLTPFPRAYARGRKGGSSARSETKRRGGFSKTLIAQSALPLCAITRPFLRLSSTAERVTILAPLASGSDPSATVGMTTILSFGALASHC